MVSNSLISVILPTYNRGDFISRSVRSIQNQTYPHWELIVVDDGSEDNTDKIINEFIRKDSRISYIKLTKNVGASRARNKGIELSKGDYITFIDSDDEYLSEKIKSQLELFLADKTHQIGLVTCGRQDFRADRLYNVWVPAIKSNVLSNLFKGKQIGAGTPFLMVSRKVIESGVRFDININVVEDFDFVVQTLVNGFNLDFVNKPLVNVFHDAQERNFNYEQGFSAREYLYKKYKDYFIRNKTERKSFLLKSCFFYVEMNNRNKDSNIIRDVKKEWPMAWFTFLIMRTIPKGRLRNAFIKLHKLVIK
ncbi:glycosyltransferase family 2 protein [Albibacterium bauzanense]|uniref:Glycosyltransferase involved in cell wall biosynthesis n=1 Tax=Albibacterium bauzanense TaxID=653929 RepID=A0A4R1M257_9SPHI|nr:glycosyltransferase family 2 protein [Albibacterium bauzanense]TCK84924.1 glycosyltransferase involved in cell wall biosynthesis [Albibacterium bauzanense]